MINYLGIFFFILSRNGNLFETSSNTDSNHLVASLWHAFKKLAKMISTPPILHYNDLNEEVTIETDVRDHKLGAVLIQGAGLVAFARHSITDERWYTENERDFLFSTGSRSWLHTFRRGKSTAVTNHKRTREVTKVGYFDCKSTPSILYHSRKQHRCTPAITCSRLIK